MNILLSHMMDVPFKLYLIKSILLCITTIFSVVYFYHIVNSFKKISLKKNKPILKCIPLWTLLVLIFGITVITIGSTVNVVAAANQLSMI